MNIKELKAEAKKLGLIGYSQLNKEDLEYLIAVSKQEVIEILKRSLKPLYQAIAKYTAMIMKMTGIS